MKLFERILEIVEKFGNNSQAQFAKKIGVSQSAFNSYLNSTGQAKIRKDLLDKIYSLYPQISRNWLYFGEGQMLENTLPLVDSASPTTQTELIRLRAEVDRLVDTLARQEELVATQKELIAAKDSIIELQRNQRQGNALISTAE